MSDKYRAKFRAIHSHVPNLTSHLTRQAYMLSTPVAKDSIAGQSLGFIKQNAPRKNT